MTELIPKIKVLQFIPGFNYGGIESITFNICKYIDKSRFQIDILVEGTSETSFLKKFERLNCKIYRTKKFSIKNAYQYYKDLIVFFQQHDYDIIHSYNIVRSPILFWAARKNGVQGRIFHARTSLSDTNPLKRIIYRLFILCGSILSTDHLACSDAAGRYFFGRRKVLVVKNGIDISSFSFNQERREKMRKKLNIAPNKYIIGHVGRFCEAKNHKFLIEIFKQINNRSKDFFLLLIGDGPLLDLIKELCQDNFIANKVLFAGKQDKLFDWYQAMDIFVFPSIYEGFGNVAIEAQAAGLEVIVSRNVPSSIQVSNLVNYMSLDDSAQMWADIIMKKCKENSFRRNMYEELRYSGYDIKENIHVIENVYQKIFERKKKV